MPYDRDPPVIAPAHLLPPSLSGCAPRGGRSFAGDFHSWFTDPKNLWARVTLDIFTLGTTELANLAMSKDAQPSYTSMLQDQSDDPNAPSPDDQTVAPTDSPAGTNDVPSVTATATSPQFGPTASADPSMPGDAGAFAPPGGSPYDNQAAAPDDGSALSDGNMTGFGIVGAKKAAPRRVTTSHNTPAHHQAKNAVKDALKKQVPGQDKAYGDGWKAGKNKASPAQVDAAVHGMSKIHARSYRHAWKVASGRVEHKMPNFGPHPSVVHHAGAFMGAIRPVWR